MEHGGGDEIGIKKYENDYDADDLLNLYDIKEIKDNTFQINYNREKMIRMKLKKEIKIMKNKEYNIIEFILIY